MMDYILPQASTKDQPTRMYAGTREKLTLQQARNIRRQILRSSPWIWQVIVNNTGSVVTVYEIEYSPPHQFDDTDNYAHDPFNQEQEDIYGKG
jgi:hypothetical protein